MDITDTQALRARFAETYDPEGGPHLLRKFEQYEIVMSCREATGAGGGKLNTWTGVSEGRIKGWLYQDSAPRGYRACERAAELGLFDLDWDGEQFRGLNELVAWVLSGGTVQERYTPVFNVEPDTRGVCEAALDRARAPGYVYDDQGGTTAVIRITDGQALYGRLLVALGATQGWKGKQRFGLPCYLPLAPDAVQRQFVAIYLLNRAVLRPDRDRLIIREERPDAYLDALAGLVRGVTSAAVTRATDYRIYLDPSVLDDVAVPKKWDRDVS